MCKCMYAWMDKEASSAIGNATYDTLHCQIPLAHSTLLEAAARVQIQNADTFCSAYGVCR